MINYTQVNGCFKEENLIDLIDQYSDGILGKYIDSFIVNNSAIDIELYINNIGIELYKDTVSFDDCRYYHPTFRFGGKKLILTNSYLNETLGVKKLKILRIEGVDVEAKPTWVSMNLSGSQKDSLLLEVEIKGEIEKLVAYPKCKKVTIYPTKLRINSHSRFTEVFELLN